MTLRGGRRQRGRGEDAAPPPRHRPRAGAAREAARGGAGRPASGTPLFLPDVSAAITPTRPVRHRGPVGALPPTSQQKSPECAPPVQSESPGIQETRSEVGGRGGGGRRGPYRERCWAVRRPTEGRPPAGQPLPPAGPQDPLCSEQLSEYVNALCTRLLGNVHRHARPAKESGPSVRPLSSPPLLSPVNQQRGALIRWLGEESQLFVAHRC